MSQTSLEYSRLNPESVFFALSAKLAPADKANSGNHRCKLRYQSGGAHSSKAPTFIRIHFLETSMHMLSAVLMLSGATSAARCIEAGHESHLDEVDSPISLEGHR